MLVFEFNNHSIILDSLNLVSKLPPLSPHPQQNVIAELLKLNPNALSLELLSMHANGGWEAILHKVVDQLSELLPFLRDHHGEQNPSEVEKGISQDFGGQEQGQGQQIDAGEAEEKLSIALCYGSQSQVAKRDLTP
jgi:hypothetical protein